MLIKAPTVVEVFEQIPEVINHDFNFGYSNRSHVHHTHDALKTLVLYDTDGHFTAYGIVRHPEYAQVCSQWQVKVLGSGDTLGKQLRSLSLGALIDIEDRKHALVAVNGDSIPSIKTCKDMLVVALCREMLKSTETTVSVLRQEELLRMERHIKLHETNADKYFRDHRHGQNNIGYTIRLYKRATVAVFLRLKKLVFCGLLEAHEQPVAFSDYKTEITVTSECAELLRWRSYAKYLSALLDHLKNVLPAE